MVQPIDSKTLGDTLREQLSGINKTHPIVGTRYFVMEITPEQRGSGYFDSDIPERREAVSPYFDTVEEAAEWRDSHIADVGKFLAIHKQYKRRTVTEAWWASHEYREQK